MAWGNRGCLEGCKPKPNRSSYIKGKSLKNKSRPSYLNGCWLDRIIRDLRSRVGIVFIKAWFRSRDKSELYREKTGGCMENFLNLNCHALHSAYITIYKREAKYRICNTINTISHNKYSRAQFKLNRNLN